MTFGRIAPIVDEHTDANGRLHAATNDADARWRRWTKASAYCIDLSEERRERPQHGLVHYVVQAKGPRACDLAGEEEENVIAASFFESHSLDRHEDMLIVVVVFFDVVVK